MLKLAIIIFEVMMTTLTYMSTVNFECHAFIINSAVLTVG